MQRNVSHHASTGCQKIFTTIHLLKSGLQGRGHVRRADRIGNIVGYGFVLLYFLLRFIEEMRLVTTSAS